MGPARRTWFLSGSATARWLVHAVRRDGVDKTGCFTLRYRSRLHHVGIGRAHVGKRILILMADLDVRVIDAEGSLLRHFELDSSVDYQARSNDGR